MWTREFTRSFDNLEERDTYTDEGKLICQEVEKRDWSGRLIGYDIYDGNDEKIGFRPI